MKFHLCAFLLALVLLTGCTTAQSPPPAPPALKTVTLDNTVNIAAGQTVYVPVYSHIYTVEQRRTIDLTATLSVRNTDSTHPIILSTVNYFNGNGTLVRKYLEQPVELNPLAATEYVISQQDASGGAGASFIVEWIAQTQVSEPVVEAVMIHTLGNQGISFVGQGRVIKSR
jgi:spore germination protein YaaH